MTDIATIAREKASNCEAKLHAFRKTQDGVVVSFVLHPNDVPAAIQLAPLGTRYVLALVEIGEDEKPVERGKTQDTVPSAQPAPVPTPDKPARATKSWHEMDYAQQAGVLCNDPKFRRFVAERIERPEASEEQAKWYIYNFCGVGSRADIKRETSPGTRWLVLVSAYRAWEAAPRAGAA